MEANNGSSLFTIVAIIWAFTLFRSILVMLVGKNIFQKATKGEKTAFYPVINLFTLLEVAGMSTFWGILLFVPFLNLIVLSLMSYKLGTSFNTGMGYKLGLVLLPIVFYPLLAFSNKHYKVNDEAYFKSMESAKNDSINLMTDEEIRRAAEKLPHDEKEDVDSIFKSNIQMMEQVEPYKAAKIDVLGMERLKADPTEDPTLKEFGVKKTEPTPPEPAKSENDNTEKVDL